MKSRSHLALRGQKLYLIGSCLVEVHVTSGVTHTHTHHTHTHTHTTNASADLESSALKDILTSSLPLPKASPGVMPK